MSTKQNKTKRSTRKSTTQLTTSWQKDQASVSTQLAAVAGQLARFTIPSFFYYPITKEPFMAQCTVLCIQYSIYVAFSATNILTVARSNLFTLLFARDHQNVKVKYPKYYKKQSIDQYIYQVHTTRSIEIVPRGGSPLKMGVRLQNSSTYSPQKGVHLQNSFDLRIFMRILLRYITFL